MFALEDIASLSVLSQEIGWKNVSEMTYFVSGGTQNLNSKDTASASLTTWTLYNRQHANFGTCYVVAQAYNLEQQNAGRAHAGLFFQCIKLLR